jgi:protein-L-isoaspartate(D-aspartate) O-methyltransferase
MPDFATARRMMVEGQLRTFDITDQDILAAMLRLPRETFVPASSIPIAYLDTEVPVDARGMRRMMTPMIFGKMLQVAEISPTHHVLDVGCATGYSSAVLSRLSAGVTALEEDTALARQARQNLAAVGASQVSVVEGQLVEGWAPGAPYDRIIVNGRCDETPSVLLGQLKENGVLVFVAGPGPATKIMIYRLLDGKISARPAFDGFAPLLPGFARPLAFQF